MTEDEDLQVDFNDSMVDNLLLHNADSTKEEPKVGYKI